MHFRFMPQRCLKKKIGNKNNREQTASCCFDLCKHVTFVTHVTIHAHACSNAALSSATSNFNSSSKSSASCSMASKVNRERKKIRASAGPTIGLGVSAMHTVEL